ncbi:glycosyltransferase [Sphingomonas rustica]|uniref:glycosyltransferase n=1 Tax=Sphingomonas rustica TaxID=3103142 RepID=UPI0031FC1FE8
MDLRDWRTVKVTIGIKALNEAAHIEASVRSALAAVAPLGGRVVLADSGSRDATTDIARPLDVRVVQLADPGDASCGAGAQLAYQYAEGEYFCLIDGDMTLVPGFLEAGLAYLEVHPDVAGVGGEVIERNLSTLEFQIRAAAVRDEAHRREGLVDRLDGGGIYRMAAIRQVGYFSDRNLGSFEEFELAARLDAAGWKLARIDVPAIEHSGHSGSSYPLLLRRLTSGQLSGAGQVLRSALGRRQLPFVLTRLKHVRAAMTIWAWWCACVACGVFAPLALPALLLGPCAFLVWRRGSLRLGIFSFCQWNLVAVGIIAGLLRSRVPPDRPVPAVELSPQSKP